MQFSDLEFKPHKLGGSHAHARAIFLNGYGASVITGPYTYSDSDHPYELAVMKHGRVCFDTHIADDVLAYQTEEQITALLAAIESLPCAGGA